MTRKGRDFEIEYASLFELDTNKYKVESPGKIYDKSAEIFREVDVLITYKDEKEKNRYIVVECRDRKCGEDVKSIEQLIQKKEDMGVDYYVIVSKYKFSSSAIKKAKYHGVIIENAEVIDKSNIEKIEKEFFFDVFYIIVKIKYLNFLIGNKSVCLKELLNRLSFSESQELLNSLNNDLFLDLNFLDILKQNNIETTDFFNVNNFSSALIDDIKYVNDKACQIVKKLDISAVSYQLEIRPFRLSLPLNKSISTFTVEKHSNKAFKAVFGDDEDNITIGYIDNKKIIARSNLKPRKYHRIVGGTSTINTIFSKYAEIEFSIKDEYDVVINSFNYEDLY